MSRKLLWFGAVVVLVLVAFAAGAFAGPLLGLRSASGVHPGLHAMHPGHFGVLPFGPIFGWGMMFAGGLRLVIWLAQIALIAVLVAWLLKPRAHAPPPSNPPQANP